MRTCVFLLLLFSNLSLAAATTKGKPAVNSAQNRSEKDWQATFGLGHLAPIFGLRARFSSFLSQDELVFAEISGGGAVQSLLFSSTLSKDPTEGRKASVGYKHFLFNSFYLEGSGFFRVLKRNAYQNSYLQEIIFWSRAAGVELVLGNQWQWSKFTLGVDWIGLHAPLYAVSEHFQGDDDTAYFRKKKRNFDTYSESVQPILLGFYIGFSF